MPKVFKTVSMTQGVTAEEIEEKGVKITTFLSFGRAIAQDQYPRQELDNILGYQVTDVGIVIIYKS